MTCIRVIASPVSFFVPQLVTQPESANVHVCTIRLQLELCVEVCVFAPDKSQSLQCTSDLIYRARRKHWNDSLEPTPTNSD